MQGSTSLALVSFLMLNASIGYMSKLKNPLIAVAMAVLCAFLPNGFMIFFLSVFMLVHLYAISAEFALIVLGISTETDNEYVEPLIQEVYNEIDKLHREPVPMEELTMVRNYMLGEMCRSYESPFSLADAWIFIATSGLDDQYFSRSLQAVNEVTPQEIQELAQRYLCKETLKEVIAGKKLS